MKEWKEGWNKLPFEERLKSIEQKWIEDKNLDVHKSCRMSCYILN